MSSTNNPNDMNGGSTVRNELEEINLQVNRVQDQVRKNNIFSIKKRYKRGKKTSSKK